MNESKGKFESLKKEIYQTMGADGIEKLQTALQSRCNEHIKHVKTNHNKKLLKLWLKQRQRSPDCLINLSDRQLSLEERNVLYRGLQHHIIPKKINAEQLKVNVEKLYKTVSSSSTSERTHVGVDPLLSEVKDELKCLTRNFLN